MVLERFIQKQFGQLQIVICLINILYRYKSLNPKSFDPLDEELKDPIKKKKPQKAEQIKKLPHLPTSHPQICLKYRGQGHNHNTSSEQACKQ